jgi:hypothetical protein
MSLKDDDIIRLIENFKFDAGPVAVERRNRGFTLIHAETGVPIGDVVKNRVEEIENESKSLRDYIHQ